jgi:hypothetical protein
VPPLILSSPFDAGRRKRIFGTHKLMAYKRPDFKKAYVTLDLAKMPKAT